jgi:hypothetical protein
VLLLSPEKLLFVLVVALVVLGPDTLPGAARRVSSTWRTIRALRARLEAEARTVFPDLPPFDSLTQAVRSPISYLDGLSSDAGVTTGVTVGAPASPGTEAVGTGTPTSTDDERWRASSH